MEVMGLVLREFAATQGVGADKQAVLVLDGAGWQIGHIGDGYEACPYCISPSTASPNKQSLFCTQRVTKDAPARLHVSPFRWTARR